MKRIVTIFFVFIIVVYTFLCCNDDQNIPVVSTTEISGITQTSVKCGGVVTADNGYSVTEKGVVYSTEPSPTIDDFKTSDGSGGGSFTSQISDLTPNTNYYIRAFATNSEGTGYGLSLTFKTLPIPILLPQVFTTPITNITTNSAISGGVIIDDGGAPITAKGVLFLKNLTWLFGEGTKTTDGSGSEEYISNMNNLTPNATYYVCAYAKNSAGYSYGNLISFTTLEAPYTSCPSCESVIDICGNIYNTVQIGNQCWFRDNLKTTKFNDGSDILYKEYNNDTDPQYAKYNHSDNLYNTYGALYNWDAVMTGQLCPNGWHVSGHIHLKEILDS